MSHNFNGLSALVGCWLSVFIRRMIYKFLNVCPFDYTAFAVSCKVGSSKPFNHTGWVAVVTPSDRRKSVQNRCVIEVLVAFLSRCFLGHRSQRLQ